MSVPIAPLPPPTTPQPVHGGHGHGHGHGRVKAEPNKQAFVEDLQTPAPAKETPAEVKTDEIGDSSVSRAAADGQAGGRGTTGFTVGIDTVALVPGTPLGPLLEADPAGRAPLEHFSSDYGADPGGGAAQIHAVIVKDDRLVAIVDRAGNVRVRSPAGDAVREAMWTLSSPADRTVALASLYRGEIRPASLYRDMPTAMNALGR